MKAALYKRYGPPEVLHIEEIDKPIPKDDEVLIKIKATSVTSGDVRMRGFDVPFIFWLPFRIFMGFFKPKEPVLGVDLAGEIEAVGKDVSRFKVGDEVYGSSYPYGGTYAEYCCVSEKGVILTKPENLKFEEAAPIFFGGHTALHFLRAGDIKAGQKVLIYGASGCVGTYAVQLAKYFGADVTAVCSTANLELVNSLEADRVLDYTKEDYISKDSYDIIFDTVGQSSFFGCVKSLKSKGKYLRAVHMNLSTIFYGIWIGVFTSKRVIGGVAGENIDDAKFLKLLCEEGKLKPVIDKIYPLEQIVEAHRYVETGRKKGNVVIRI